MVALYVDDKTRLAGLQAYDLDIPAFVAFLKQ